MFPRAQLRGGLRPVCLSVSCFMASRIHLAWVVLALGAVLLPGCSHSSANRHPGAGPAALEESSDAQSADYSSAAIKARTESQARYLAAILYEQNDESELAADEFYRAALAD